MARPECIRLHHANKTLSKFQPERFLRIVLVNARVCALSFSTKTQARIQGGGVVSGLLQFLYIGQKTPVRRFDSKDSREKGSQEQRPQPYFSGVWPPGAQHSTGSVSCLPPTQHDATVLQHVARLQQENAGLRNYAERVTKELRSARLSQAIAAAAQAAGGNPAAAIPPAAAAELQQQAERLPLPPWCLNMQLVSPLLAAYDERILELQEEAKEREKVITQFTERIAIVTRENEQLAEELRSKTERLQQLFEADAGLSLEGGCFTGSAVGKTYNCLLQERNELEELYSLTAEQSEVLLSQNHLLKYHVQQSEAALEEMRALVGDTERRAVAVAAREETVARQEETAARQAVQLKEALDKNKELSKKLSLSEKETERLSTALQESVKQHEMHQDELQQHRATVAAVDALQQEVEQFKSKLEAVTKEKDAAKEVADYLEQRLAVQAKEAEDIRKQIDSTTQQLHAVVVEREKATATATLLQQHLDQLRGQHETELQLLREAQGDALERRATHAEELAEKLRKQLEELQRSHGEARVKLEAAERRAASAAADASQAREELAVAGRHHQTLQQHLHQAQAATETELARLKEQLSLQTKEAAAKAAALLSSKRQLEDSLAAAESARLALQQQQQALQTKCEDLQGTSSMQQKQLAEVSARLAAAELEGEAARRRAEREAADAKRRYESLAALAEAKAARIQEAAERRQTATAQRLLEEQQQRQRLAKEYEAQKERMQQQLRKAVATNATLRSKVNELLNGLDQTLPAESVLDEDEHSELSP
ncbi:hypothetical protein Emag_003467 [Eimeria magna]